MSRYILKRLLMLIPVILGVSFVVFFIMSLAPGDPVTIIAGAGADETTLEAVRQELGLDQPLLVQYARYMSGLLRGDLGQSYLSNRSVFEEYVTKLPATLELTLWSMLIAVGISLPIGILSAVKQYSLLDNAGMVVALLGVSMPNFWLGLMLIIVFSLHLGWLPSGGSDGFSSIILPAITVGTGLAALITRMTRSSMLEVIRQDYVKTARAKGQKEFVVIMRHVYRNALIPIVTVVGLQFGHLLGGAMLTEVVFSIPGVGRLMIDAIKQRDFPIVQGSVLFVAACFSVVNLLVDILYAFIDPKVSKD